RSLPLTPRFLRSKPIILHHPGSVSNSFFEHSAGSRRKFLALLPSQAIDHTLLRERVKSDVVDQRADQYNARNTAPRSTRSLIFVRPLTIRLGIATDVHQQP
ncbi:hypothetical protein, partial [uncultured Lamprocystis sp.]|uniref:hypothetical protein n=1 Tax=uncultured Lamprocystis sp. TaxID=543132 RepID=UPI0025D3C9A2